MRAGVLANCPLRPFRYLWAVPVARRINDNDNNDDGIAVRSVVDRSGFPSSSSDESANGPHDYPTSRVAVKFRLVNAHENPTRNQTPTLSPPPPPPRIHVTRT